MRRLCKLQAVETNSGSTNVYTHSTLTKQLMYCVYTGGIVAGKNRVVDGGGEG